MDGAKRKPKRKRGRKREEDKSCERILWVYKRICDFFNSELDLKIDEVEGIMNAMDREELGDKWKYVVSVRLIMKLEEWGKIESCEVWRIRDGGKNKKCMEVHDGEDDVETSGGNRKRKWGDGSEDIGRSGK